MRLKKNYFPVNIDACIRDLGMQWETVVKSLCCGNELFEKSMRRNKIRWESESNICIYEKCGMGTSANELVRCSEIGETKYFE